MDDMLLFSNDREQLAGWGKALEEACFRQRLRLHPWQVRPTWAGVTWLGFRILPGEVRVKRATVERARKRLAEKLAAARGDPEAMAEFAASLRATFAHWEHGTTFRLRGLVLRELGMHEDDAFEPEKK